MRDKCAIIWTDDVDDIPLQEVSVCRVGAAVAGRYGGAKLYGCTGGTDSADGLHAVSCRWAVSWVAVRGGHPLRPCGGHQNVFFGFGGY